MSKNSNWTIVSKNDWVLVKRHFTVMVFLWRVTLKKLLYECAAYIFNS